ncbi:MAG TPA: peptidylprolyl isomerase [Thermomicrobiales bacterium]|nr:peptidylprolyl isomerase [Thermomicrobiales bacterium]
MRRGILVTVVLVVLLALLAACGEDDGVAGSSASADNPAATCSTATPLEGGSASYEGDPKEMQWNQPPAMALEEGRDYCATIKTSKGDIVVDLFEKDAPRTVNNFVFLAQQGYYKGVPFHRIISGFMIQTGDPTGTGAGSPGYRFQDELPTNLNYTRGTLAMANAGPDTNGSQFFICHADLTNSLQKNYSIFGTVTDGIDVVDAIASVPVGPSRSGEMSSPKEPVSIESVEITVK